MVAQRDTNTALVKINIPELLIPLCGYKLYEKGLHIKFSGHHF